jgi:plasmid stabilization system protein ParE
MESLDAVYEYIADENPAAAKQVFRRIVGATRRLEEFPFSCPAGKIADTRELVVPGLAFLIVYRIRGETVEILRVFHAAMQRTN